MDILENSQEITGYRVKVVTRGAFRVWGYTLVLPPVGRGDTTIPRFWDDVIADGRLKKLREVSSVPTCVLGLGSWDPEVPRRGQRYTICIEETVHTDFTRLATETDLFSKEIGASDWLCFETRLGDEYPQRFWKDNPYKMMGLLGYQFYGAEGDYRVGLHFEAYPPSLSFGSSENTTMEFWITVVKV